METQLTPQEQAVVNSVFAGLSPGNTDSKITTSTVGVSSGQLIGGDPNRITIIFINKSPNSIYIDFAPITTLGDGILLTPNGGFFNTRAWEDFILTKQPWHARASGAGSKLAIVNVTQFRS